MAKILNARIDDQTQKALEELVAFLGCTESELVREGIRILSITKIPSKQRKKAIKGIGQFASKNRGLASNKRHLKGFGR